MLVGVAETWAAGHSCTELASDVLIDKTDGLALHGALGFHETERVVYFIKNIRLAGPGGLNSAAWLVPASDTSDHVRPLHASLHLGGVHAFLSLCDRTVAGR
jgi:hypothetical protein